MKIRTITVIHSKLFNTYYVTKVTDSLQISPGNEIKKSDLQSMCDNQFWKVTVVEDK